MAAVRSLLVVAVCGLAFSLPLRGSVPRGPDDIIFDYVAASQCGILTAAIERGFHMELAEVTARLALSPSEARVVRTKGWIAAERNWRDRQEISRGTTCRNAAARFSAVATGTPVP